MIDKLEFRIPARAQFSGKFGKLYREVRHEPKVDPFRPSKHYFSVGDLRPFGHDVVLHMYCVHGKDGNHKVELLDAGVMGYRRMLAEVEQIFDLDAQRLTITRVDFAADVKGVSVPWFTRHVRARWKRWVCDIGEITRDSSARMGRNQIQTLYLGRRPNCVRIYDKLAEYRDQYKKLLRKASDAAELPTFESLYGLPQDGVILTRVERQAGGGRVPAAVETLAQLKKATEFNPFERLDFFGSTGEEPRVKDWGLQKYGFGSWLKAQAEDIGIHRLRCFLNEYSARNAAKILREFAPFFPPKGGITAQELFELYRESLQRQLAA